MPTEEEKTPEGTQENANAGGNGGRPTSQAELDAQFADRARRAQEAERKRMLEALGVQSEDDLKKIVAERKQAEEAAKSELEKLADRARKLEADKARIEQEAAQRLAEAERKLADAEIRIFATRPVTDKDGKVTRAPFRPEALDAVVALIDRSELASKDGKLEGLEKALDKLAKAHPYMLTEAGPTRPQPAGTPDATRQPRASQPRTQANQAQDGGLEFNSL